MEKIISKPDIAAAVLLCRACRPLPKAFSDSLDQALNALGKGLVISCVLLTLANTVLPLSTTISRAEIFANTFYALLSRRKSL